MSNQKRTIPAKKIKLNQIKVVLAEIGMTQKELREKTGLSRTTISNICTNAVQPTIQHLHDIAVAMGVNVQRLLIPTEEKKR
jgi:transcriptional regulator with XRE-family HTH domain